MSDTAVLERPAERTAPRGERFTGGWRIVARKELADHLLSARFAVLIAVLGVAAAAAVFSASGGIRGVASAAQGVPALFLKLFTVTTDPVPFPFVTFIGFLAPLLGIMFGFDAVNGERAQGTLPRLVAQPIHRDEVIIGKFVAGLTVIGVMLTALTLLVSGIGIYRLGIVPTTAEISRLAVWIVLAIIYVGFWLALATAASVFFVRAASSALVSVGTWLVLALFGNFLFRALAGIFASSDNQIATLTAQVAVSRISPITLFTEASSLLLDPTQRATGLVLSTQVDRALVSNLSLGQSLLVVSPQMIGLLAMTVVVFAAAFIAFMRQEVRA